MPKHRRPTDNSKGMDGIDRRDFLQGTAVSIAGVAAASALPSLAQAAAALAQPTSQNAPGYYPPERTGMRGSHPGSFEGAHALRDGKPIPPVSPTGEAYDLVVAGGGISGLSAAWFFHKARPDAKILILDNHDDFGGHAKRNEFHVDGKTLLINGGTLLIDSPYPYSDVAAGLIKSLGIDPDALSKASRQDTYQKMGLRQATFYDKETFGQDKLVLAPPRGGRRGATDPAALMQALADAPLSEAVKRDIVRVETGTEDYLPGLTLDQKMERLSKISYRDYLLQIAKVDPGVIPYYQTRTHGEWGIGIDGEPALDCWGIGNPGFQGLGLDRKKTNHMGYTAAGYSSTGGSYRYHFPDGNASIARLLVRQMVPGVAPGSTATDVIMARYHYPALDKPGQPVRIRLSSVVVNARNLPDGRVQVTYEHGGTSHTVTGKNCILAGYNMMIPYIVPDLPAAQKAALHQLVKVPLIYTSVAVRNWRPFAKLGISGASCPGGYWTSMSLAEAQNIGGYQTATSPDEPVIVHLVRTPCKPGAPTERDQHRAGRYEMLATPFETFEQHIKDQMTRVLGAGGFDANRDIAGIMVNRWPHGYAYEYNSLYDPEVPEDQRPHIIGRKRFGRIAIANSDSGAAAYTSSAIDQGHRAAEELLSA